MNTQLQKKLMLGTLSLALMIGAVPQNAFADAAAKTQPAKAQTVTITKLNSAAVTGVVMKATLMTPAKSVDQLTFKEFIKDMNPKSNMPSKILIQAEKDFKQYQTEIKAKQDKKAMQSFEQLMKLLAPYQDFKMISVMVDSTGASYTGEADTMPLTATVPATTVVPAATVMPAATGK